MNKLRIIMYHYVRSRELGRYPGLKVRDTDEFERQLNYIDEKLHPVGAEDIVAVLSGQKKLPENACFLTFDDGYLDHYLTVFPALSKRGWSGAFYPPVQAVRGQKVMQVNKIQLLLAHHEKRDFQKLLKDLRRVYEKNQAEIGINMIPEGFDQLRARLSEKGTYDSADTVFIKKLLQYELPKKVREKIVNELFEEILDIDESTLAAEMYMTEDMLKVMAKAGMHIGSHGDSHSWLSWLNTAAQEQEIDESLKMLERIHGTPDFTWSMCYPFGAYNDATIQLCKNRSCSFAVTTKPDTAVISTQDAFILPRLDTNSLPV